MDARSTGRFIKEERIKRGLSQKALGELLFVEPQTVSKWERGVGFPDYPNVLKLAEIFSCSVQDILEPQFEDESENESEDESKDEGASTNLPVLVKVLEDAEPKRKKRKSIFQLFSKHNLKKQFSKLFGVNYQDFYTKEFFLSGALRKRSKEEYGTALSYGFTSEQKNVMDVAQPWLYIRAFFFLLICFAVGSFASALSGVPEFAIIFGSCFSVLPLLILMYELNFSRDVNLFQLLSMFIFGGFAAIILVLLFGDIIPLSELSVTPYIFAPIIEELAKAVIAVIFIAKMKPKNVLTGILIGFAVGAGFDVFENMLYSFTSYLEGIFLYQDPSYYIGTILIRTLSGFCTGHHYCTAIFAGVYLLCKKKSGFAKEELFQPRVLGGFLVAVLLHALWNTSSLLGGFGFVLMLAVSAASVIIFFFLSSLGVSQMKAMDIYKSAKAAESAAEAPAADTPAEV